MPNGFGFCYSPCVRDSPVTTFAVSMWKKEAMSNLSSVFGKGKEQTEDSQLDRLYAQIGQLKVENDFLKKKLY